MRRQNWFLSFLFVIFAVACSQSNTPEIDIDAQIVQFATETEQIFTKTYSDDDFKNYGDDFKAAFQHSFPKKMQKTIVKRASRKQLVKLEYDIYNYLLTVNDPSALAFVENIYNQIEANNWLRKRDGASMYSLYILQRQFDTAQKFRTNALQKNADYDIPQALKIDNWQTYSRTPDIGKKFVLDTVKGPGKDADYLTVNQIEFSNYTGVVAAVAPGCHFFTNFLKSVGADTDLATAFMDNTIWLTSDFLTTTHVIDWNKSMPKVQIHYAVYAEDWPEINYWGSPSFYFFKDGKLTKKIVGWPRDAVAQRTLALRDSFRAIGIEVGAPEK